MKPVAVSLPVSEFYYRLFAKLVSLVFLFAFLDSFFQLRELIGNCGLAPVGDFIANAKETFGWQAFFRFPGLFWLSSSDTFLEFVCLLGAAASLFSFLGILSGLSLFIACVSWLSLMNTGSDFFIYIWDQFLLECGWVSLLSSLLTQTKYQNIRQFIVYLLIFRLWFSMGAVTVIYPHVIGLNGTFIHYFFQNQPMPTSFSFRLFHLPGAFHSAAAWLLFVVEVCLPFLIFFRRFRIIAFWGFAGFSVLIQLSGNFAWFNILSIFAATPLLEGSPGGNRLASKFSSFVLRKFSFIMSPPQKLVAFFCYYQASLQLSFILFLFFPIGNRYLNFLNYYTYNTGFKTLTNSNVWLNTITFPLKAGANFKLANPYGVFKGIPVKRWELKFTCYPDSNAGAPKIFEYRYKPGLSEGSTFFAPHFPRLEQQLFYEAQQGSFYRNYTPYEGCINNKCWTANFIKMLQTNPDQEIPNTVHYSRVKVEVLEMRYASREEYTSTGKIWSISTKDSFIVTPQSACPLVPDSLFVSHKKHVP